LTVQLLTHLGICVSDLERSVAFYRNVFGFVETGRIEPDVEATSRILEIADAKLQAVYLERDGWRIELLYYASPGHTGSAEPRPLNQLGLTHLSFRVSDMAALLARVEAAGGSIREDSRIAIRDGASSALFVLDPDGTRIELIDVPGDPAAVPGN
jgi:catechol 2,3-dioxygenase-like lactoylglutathione lyase family enzyme